MSPMSSEAAAIGALARRVAREPESYEPQPPAPEEGDLQVRLVRSRLREFADGVDNPLVEIRGAGRAFLVPLSALEEWLRADRQPVNASVSLQEADASARARGAAGIISLDWISGCTIEIKRQGRVLSLLWRLRHRLGLY